MKAVVERTGGWRWLAALPLLLGCGAVFPQTQSGRPVRILVGTAAGGPTDTVTRHLVPRLSERLGQPIVVENRGGAGGIIASEIVAKGTPDGRTLEMVFISHAVNPTLVAKLPYDTLRDFAAISLVGYQTLLLVAHPSLGVSSVRELIELAKDRPGRLNYGSDTGNAAHLSAELLSYMTGVKLVHIPYKGQAPAMIDTLAGQIPFMFDPVITSLQYVKAGRLKALASTGARRSPQAPEVPTMAESGLPGFEVTAWYGLVAPAKTPRDIVAQIGKATGEVLRAGEVRDRLVATGTEVVGGTPDEFDAHIRREIAKWEKVLKAARIAGTF